MSSVNSIKGLKNTAPTLFQPTIVRSIADEPHGANAYNLSTAGDTTDTSIESTSSFKYNLPGEGLRSTQQLNIDWSDFSNHTFFNSAQVKVNVAFDRIQNQFPFDGTNKETEAFLDVLTGFEKWVFDGYPKHKGYLFLSGTNGTEAFGGTFITVKDLAGAAYPQVSRKRDGVPAISPGLDSMTIEFWLYVPTQINDRQMILDKHSGSQGFMIALSSSNSVATATASMAISSGSLSLSLSDVHFTKGEWNHLTWIWNRTPGVSNISAYVGDNLFATSSTVELGTIDTSCDMYIGSGSTFPLPGISFVPQNTLSGAMDELRIWHEIREIDQIKESKAKTVFATDGLKLCYKFNEASGSNSSLVIDSSANSLHGNLSAGGTLLGVRQHNTASIAGTDPMTYERLDLCPILFPTQIDVSDYRTELMVSASSYDNGNPNIITRLIPKHYLIEGQIEEALSTEEGEILESLTTGVDPRSTSLGATQVYLLLLYTWAKFFDEMKLYTQAFADLNFVDYDDTDTVPDQFLQQLARSQGIELPPMFSGATIDQFLNSNNVQGDISTNTLSLQYIQNQIWRRILVNLRDIVSSKGTIHGVKSFIRATGIDPDNNFRIREYGGPTKQHLGFARDFRSEISTMIDFVSGGLIQSPFLSGSRIEPGYPWMSGVLTNGTSSGMSDGLFTSGSWTFEGTYKFQPSRGYAQTQSLVRFQTTGSSTTGSLGEPAFALIGNLLAVSGTNPSVTFFARANGDCTLTSSNSTTILTVTGVDMFDGDKWYVSVGRFRKDDTRGMTTGSLIHSYASSSYFLRVAKQTYGEMTQEASSSAWYFDPPGQGVGGMSNLWEQKQSEVNASGSWLAIGSSSVSPVSGPIEAGLLNDINHVPNMARETNMQGKVTQIRFWSKGLQEAEWREHVRNFRSVGVQDPLVNFNFNTKASGSWDRLRIDASTDQQITSSDGTGTISVFDFSQNLLHLNGTNFPFTKSIAVPERFFYSYISPKFDEASTTEKVRVRSFQEFSNVQATPWAQVAPVYEIPRSEQPTDSTKFTIDYSIVEALNQDIMTIFSTLDALDNIIGSPELIFSPDYPGLEDLREIYFNKMTDKINLKTFFEFYKWFDTNIGSFVSQLIPRKTKFLGTNFVIESHMLERPKFEYLFTDIYLGDNHRSSLRDTILMQLFVGAISRY